MVRTKTILGFYKTPTTPTLLYGSQIWTLTSLPTEKHWKYQLNPEDGIDL